MHNDMQQYRNVDEYIDGFPQDIQIKLRKIREAIKQAAPDAEETIVYRMPAYRQNGPLAYFAAFKDHIGFFPTPAGINNFEKELGHYKISKGTVRFSLDEPIPYELIAKIVKFKVTENTVKK